MAIYQNLKCVDLRKHSKHLYYVYYDGTFVTEPTLFVCSSLSDIVNYIGYIHARDCILYKCKVSKIY